MQLLPRWSLVIVLLLLSACGDAVVPTAVWEISCSDGVFRIIDRDGDLSFVPLEGVTSVGACGQVWDCDDHDPEVGPAIRWYLDLDTDRYGAWDDNGQLSCSQPPGAVNNNTDCDDTRANVRPTAKEVCDGIDNNCDAKVDGELDADRDGYVDAQCNGDDCDDIHASINPGSVERCDGIDQNCDGVVDEGVTEIFYPDGDGDGYGDLAGLEQTGCVPEEGNVVIDDNHPADCADNNGEVNPGADEVCDGIDNDCDDLIDDDDPTTDFSEADQWVKDSDGDHYAESPATLSSCEQPEGYVAPDTLTSGEVDCNDTDPAINPGVSEICDGGVDNDCNPTTTDEETTWYYDGDHDGFGTDDDTVHPIQKQCDQPPNYTLVAGDCDDNDAGISPSAADKCNGVDENCNGQIDDGFDKDADGSSTCESSSNRADCDDTNPAIHPGGQEQCNNVDDDCDGIKDDGFDQDGDGYVSCAQGERPADCKDLVETTYPGAPELCNGVDDNCDGEKDEGLDKDGDTYSSCSLVDNPPDCDDTREDINPGASEICNNADDNCSGTRDEGFDQDKDGYVSCQQGERPADCNDAVSAINPTAQELCNSKDDNCDGMIDEGHDKDGDGFSLCSIPADCEDTNPAIKPGGIEVCNGKDDNCNGSVDEIDVDGDGYSPCLSGPNPGDCDDTNGAVNPGATEVCNSIDDDCDGNVDVGIGTTWYFDKDGDGYGTNDPATNQTRCVKPEGYASVAGDCWAEDPLSFPGAPELCDGKDNDCDTTESKDEGFYDLSTGTSNCGAWAYVPPQTFCWGGPDANTRTITLTYGFYVLTTEVTKKMWTQLLPNGQSDLGVGSTDCSADGCPEGSLTWTDGITFANKASTKANLTIAYVNNGNTNPYAAWDWNGGVTAVGYRIPTEAEWEAAIRAEWDLKGNGSYVCEDYYDGTTYSQVDETSECNEEVSAITDIAWYKCNSPSSGSSTAASQVNKLLPNDYYVYDMSGNLREWVWDSNTNIYGDGSEDPAPPSTTTSKMIKGGHHNAQANEVMSKSRVSQAYNNTSPVNGIRIVRTACTCEGNAPGLAKCPPVQCENL